jgi:hypothetical protein
MVMAISSGKNTREVSGVVAVNGRDSGGFRVVASSYGSTQVQAWKSIESTGDSVWSSRFDQATDGDACPSDKLPDSTIRWL